LLREIRCRQVPDSKSIKSGRSQANDEVALNGKLTGGVGGR
jgi:hypothetical protein